MNFKELPVALLYEVPHKPACQAILFEAAQLLRINGYKVKFTNPVLYESAEREKAELVIMFDIITSKADIIKADHYKDGSRIIILPLDVNIEQLPEILFAEQPKKAKGRKKQSTISDEERE